VGETGREVETACRAEVRVGVFGVGRGCDEGAAVVELGEANAGVEIAQMLRAWKEAGVRGVVWDHAAFHKAKAVGEVRLRRVYQPPYSPELNPAERVLEEVRRWVEGRRSEEGGS
jgi:hypothetical protein